MTVRVSDMGFLISYSDAFPHITQFGQLWEEVGSNFFHFRMMEVSETSLTAEMFLQPPPDLCLNKTLALSSGGCSDLVMVLTLRC